MCCVGFIEAKCGLPQRNQLINMARSIASHIKAAERGNVQYDIAHMLSIHQNKDDDGSAGSPGCDF